MNGPREFHFIYDEKGKTERLDQFLARNVETSSRSRLAKLIDLGDVTVNEKAVKPSYKLNPGDRVFVRLPAVRDGGPAAAFLPFEIVHEDADVLVVNKPAGLVVHPATSHRNDTLVNALLARNIALSSGFLPDRPGIVHRLDRDTSGLLVIAKNDPSQESLAVQFRQRSVHRVYWAVVYGTPAENRFTIRSFLGRHEGNRKKFASTADGKGKNAVTHAEVAGSANGLSLLKIKLETGRTHQIRVHLSEKGFPIVGDVLYGAKGRQKNLKSVPLRRCIDEMKRFALHAAELGFAHPRRGEGLFFRCPWPDDLLDLIRLSCLEIDTDTTIGST